MIVAALRLLAGNRFVQIALLALAMWGAWNWRYHQGYSAAARVCEATIKATGDKAVADQAQAAVRVAAADAARAEAGRRTAEARASAAERAVAAARHNNRGVCLVKEVTDAIRAIPVPPDQ